MAAVDLQDENELADLLRSVGVSSVDNLPPAEVPPLETGTGIVKSLPRQTIVREPPTAANAAKLVQDFRLHVEKLGVSFEERVEIDLLAAYLSSQVLLFAGPSGTGKSTAARCLQTFFAPPDSRAVINGRRQLLGPEDVAGYYSPLGEVFVAGPDLASLDHLARPNAAAPCPTLLVEEVNLSAPEGYLNPFVHGFSGLSTERVEWRIFAKELEAQAGRSARLVFEPFPRLLGTINVDATAPAPAPKVAARACVVLLEPVETTDLAQVQEALEKQAQSTELIASGAGASGDPLAVVHSTDHRPKEVRDACLRLVAGLEWGDKVFEQGWTPASTPVRGFSRRQLAQIVLYTGWFDLLAQGVAQLDGVTAENPQVGAENAILHFALPSLDAVRFSIALQILKTLPLSGSRPAGLGGTLAARVERLGTADDQSTFTGRLLDFWDRLS